MLLQQVMLELVFSPRLECAEITHEWEVVRMYPFVSGQGRVLHKTLITEVTLEESLFSMSPFVCHHVVPFGAGISAERVHATFQDVAPVDSHVGG